MRGSQPRDVGFKSHTGYNMDIDAIGSWLDYEVEHAKETGEITISSRNMKGIFQKMLTDPRGAKEIALDDNLFQISDPIFVMTVAKFIIDENEKQVATYLGGKENLFGFFIGQAMKRTSNMVNPEMVEVAFRELFMVMKAFQQPGVSNE